MARKDITAFGDDWSAALDEAALWEHRAIVRVGYTGWVVAYEGDVNAIDVAELGHFGAVQ